MTTTVNFTNSTFSDLPSWANTTTGGTFWTGILYMLWAILILLFIPFGFEIALLSASFIGLVLGLMLVYADLVSFARVLVFVGIILLEVIYIVWISPKVKG